jgi:hypothetical protein
MPRLKLSRSRLLDLVWLLLVIGSMAGLAAWLYWPVIGQHWNELSTRYIAWRQGRKSVPLLIAESGSMNTTTRMRARAALLDASKPAAVPDLIEGWG